MMFGLAAVQSYLNLEAESVTRAIRTAGMLHEHALKVLETHRLVIDQVNQRLQTVDWVRAGQDTRFHALLKRLQESLDQVATITVTDETGTMRASSRVFPSDTGIKFDDRDWFIALRERAPTQPYVSKSYSGRQSGQSVFNVADRVVSDGVEFKGVVAVSVDRGYFERFYATIEEEPGNSFLLLRTDGTILARSPATSDSSVGPGNNVIEALKTSDAGVIRSRSTVDGIKRIVAYRRIANLPLAVSFGIGHQAIIALWIRDLVIYALLAACSAFALWFVTALVAKHNSRAHAALLQWQATAQELREEKAHREKLDDQLRQTQKMDAIGRLTGGVAHDFNNLLTIIIGSLDMALRRLPETEVRSIKLIQGAQEGAKRAATLTARLLAFSRRQPLDPKVLDINQLVADMSEMLRRLLGENITVETVLAGGLWRTLADPNQLENAILNLAVNAKDAMSDGGKLTIETANAHLDESYTVGRIDVLSGQYIQITVTDTGVGMSPETVSQAFEPFFTTKPVGKGTGLGLSQLYGFAKQSGGHAAIYSEPGVGTAVKLYLPRRKAEMGQVVESISSLPETPDGPFGRGELILVVEDDEAVRRFSVAALLEAGFEVLEARDGPEAIALFAGHSAIELLFTDIVLTGPLNGRQLADELLKMRPSLPVLFTTGYTRNAIIHHGRLDEGVNLIGKPFSVRQLTSKLAALLAAKRSSLDHSCGS